MIEMHRISAWQIRYLAVFCKSGHIRLRQKFQPDLPVFPDLSTHAILKYLLSVFAFEVTLQFNLSNP